MSGGFFISATIGASVTFQFTANPYGSPGCCKMCSAAHTYIGSSMCSGLDRNGASNSKHDTASSNTGDASAVIGRASGRDNDGAAAGTASAVRLMKDVIDQRAGGAPAAKAAAPTAPPTPARP